MTEAAAWFLKTPAGALQPHLAPPKATEAKGSRLAIAAVGSHSGLALGVSNALLEALKDETEADIFGGFSSSQSLLQGPQKGPAQLLRPTTASLSQRIFGRTHSSMASSSNV